PSRPPARQDPGMVASQCGRLLSKEYSMPSPFPGMDPYLERPQRWQSIHPQLVASLPGILEPLLPERYAVSVEDRVYLTVTHDAIRLRRPDAMIVDTGDSAPAPAHGGGPAGAPPPRAPQGGV